MSKFYNKIIIVFALGIYALYAQDSRESSLESNRQNGFVGRIGIGADYLYHKADSSSVSGVVMSANGALGWNWRDYAKMEVAGFIGAAPNDIKGAYPIGATQIGNQPLSNFNFKGGIFGYFNFLKKL